MVRTYYYYSVNILQTLNVYFYSERGVKEVFNFHIHGALAPAGNFLESSNRLCVIEKPLTAGDDRRRQKTFLIIKFHSMRFKSNAAMSARLSFHSEQEEREELGPQ